MNSCPSGYFNCAKSDGSSIVGKPVFGCSDECTLGEGRRLGASQVQTSAAISKYRPSMRVTTAALFEMSQLQFDLHLEGSSHRELLEKSMFKMFHNYFYLKFT